MKKSLYMLVGCLVALPLVFAAPAVNAEEMAAPAAGAPVTPPPPPKVQPPKMQESKPTSEGQKLADFNLPYAFENKMAKFSDVLAAGKGAKLSILTFTNTSCAACQDEMALLTKLKSQYGKDLYVVAVVTDFNAKRIAENLGEDTKKSLVFLSDPYFTVPPLYSFKATPASAYIKDGKVVSLESGYLPTADARTALTEKIAGLIK